jgi:hypothetical protein
MDELDQARALRGARDGYEVPDVRIEFVQRGRVVLGSWRIGEIAQGL